ncbi:MAG: DNA-3-methyladenine glycosylase I, partial [Mariniphaga sp.]|nr:DNA-3-methyladenine glycosylase I [Mariniphaga sp.]
MAKNSNSSDKVRCGWGSSNDIYMEYHDNEWGVPLHDEIKLFEFLVLESFQSGLSWITILKKRKNFIHAFEGFDPNKVALFSETKVQELMQDTGIVRNRRKIEAAINNAKRFLEIQEEFGSFDK